MDESKQVGSWTSANRIITQRMVDDLFRRSSMIYILRSGVYATLGHCADSILEACRNSDHRKEFRIIFPSLTNPDIAARARAAGKHPDEVLARLADWHERLAQTALDIGPKHLLELRTTEEPHRYHGIFSDAEGCAGFALQRRASLATTSIVIGPSTEDGKWFLSLLIEDFEAYFEKCQPYELGDNKKRISRGGARVSMHPILLGFGRAIPGVIAALKFVKRGFPDANGNGATGDKLAAHTGADASDANRRLLDMERAGMLYRLCGTGSARELHGRLLTTFGETLLRDWEQTHGSDEKAR